MDYRQLDRSILGELWVSDSLWNNLKYLCDECESRFAGTPAEKLAGDYLMNKFLEYGLENVAAEPFSMPGWERGVTSLTIHLAQRDLELPCLALPGSPACHLEGEIVDVGEGSEADFKKLGEGVRGKIVLTSPSGPGRGEKYRAAVEAGATAFIFGSFQPGLLAPTGSVRQNIPAIGLAFEHYSRIQRILEGGPVFARLISETILHTATARNIVAEIPGKDQKEGWIVACGHYDGHDVAQGAQDNAAASVALLEAARLLSPLRKHLKAGIRFVLFSGEEMGLHGSYSYARAHMEELEQIRAIFNADVVGLAMPLVLQTQASPELADYFRRLPLTELDAKVNDGPKSFIMNSDHFPFSLHGIPAVWALTSFPPPGPGWMHTAADTLDKVDRRILMQSTAAITRVLLRMATDVKTLPKGHKDPATVKKLVTEAGFEKMLRYDGHWPFGDAAKE